ncbi:hypothetical protein ACP70R_015124 [Stipagrostis hirtigluma subsp. patula]
MAMALLDEHLEEVLLRFPPDDPRRLVHAALVCRQWRRVVSHPAFRRRFLDLHRAPPPMLGFLCNHGAVPRFVPTSSFRPHPRAPLGCPVIDARHGRVLTHSVPWRLGGNPLKRPFVVLDPVTGERRALPLLPGLRREQPLFPRSPYLSSWNAAVLCASTAAGACGHVHCRGGPFLVLFVATGRLHIRACVYSSEDGAWRRSKPTIAPRPGYDELALEPCALVGNALYFVFHCSRRVLEYDLGTWEMSVIDLPSACFFKRVVLMTAEDGGLGLASLFDYNLCLWSRAAAPGLGHAGWAKSRVIELKNLLPDDVLSASLGLAGIADGIRVIFLRTDDGLFTIDLKSYHVTKVCKGGWYNSIFPYMSLCTPALGADSSAEGPRASSSSASQT